MEIVVEKRLNEPESISNSTRSASIGDKTEIVEPAYTQTYICERKCVRKGDTICYSDIDDLELQENDNLEDGSTLSDGLADSIRSGESIFKTFTFEANDGSHDIEKCMAFWKTVLEKNLKPLKCTPIETNKFKEKEEVVKEKSVVVKTVSQELTELPMLWRDAWKEIQKKKLNEVKLTLKKCECCQLIDIDAGPDANLAKIEELKDIEALNNWIPEINPLFRAASRTESTSTISKSLLPPRNDPVTKSGSLKFEKGPHKVNYGFSGSLRVLVSSSIRNRHDDHLVEITKSSEMVLEAPKDFEEMIEKDSSKESQRECDDIECDRDDLEAEDASLKFEYGYDVHQYVPEEIPKACDCSCGLGDCICTEIKDLATVKCQCSCNLDDCICTEVKDTKNTECPCSCNLNDCICTQIDDLVTEKCVLEKQHRKASDQENRNDTIKIMEFSEPPSNNQPKLRSFASISCQCCDLDFKLEEAIEGYYCVICGHFDCNCKAKN